MLATCCSWQHKTLGNLPENVNDGTDVTLTPVAWARIYLGVHFPLDIVGAALVAVLSAWLAFREVRMYLPATYNLALSVHRVLFGKLIQIGWVRE